MKFRVQGRGDYLEMWDVMLPLLEGFAAKIEKHINVLNFHGSKSSPLEVKKGEINLYFWACPPGVEADSGTLERVFGLTLTGGMRDSYIPQFVPQDYIQILDEDTPVALISKSSPEVYVLFDLPHRAPEELTREVLGDLLRLLLQEACIAKAENPEDESPESRFVQICNAWRTNRRKESESKIRRSERRIREVLEELQVQRRRLEEERLLHAGLLESLEQREDEFRKMFKGILEIKGVEWVEVTEKGVSVFTDMIYLDYAGRSYKIGKFKITFGEENPTPDVINLLNEKITGQKYFHHPHIFGDRVPKICGGNLSPGMEKLVMEQDFLNATAVMIRFLRTFNQSSQYVGWLKSNWAPEPFPEKGKGKVKVKVKEKVEEEDL